MAMKINDIPPEGVTLKIDRMLDLFDNRTASTPCTSVLSIKPMGGETFHITGRVQADPVLECSRCLKSFSSPVDAEFSIDLAPAKVLGSDSEHELGQAELDTEFYQGDELDPVAIVKEQILIAIPMVPLHHPDCKGLCPSCGKDLNEADCGCRKNSNGEFGSFAALRDLFNK